MKQIFIIGIILFLLATITFADELDDKINNYIREKNITCTNEIEIRKIGSDYVVKIDTPNGLYFKGIGGGKEKRDEYTTKQNNQSFFSMNSEVPEICQDIKKRVYDFVLGADTTDTFEILAQEILDNYNSNYDFEYETARLLDKMSQPNHWQTAIKLIEKEIELKPSTYLQLEFNSLKDFAINNRQFIDAYFDLKEKYKDNL